MTERRQHPRRDVRGRALHAWILQGDDEFPIPANVLDVSTYGMAVSIRLKGTALQGGSDISLKVWNVDDNSLQTLSGHVANALDDDGHQRLGIALADPCTVA